jgi:hypothetical protein
MITETLRRIQLFAGFTEEQLRYVRQGNEIRLRPGEYVKRAGDPPDGFYIVIERASRRMIVGLREPLEDTQALASKLEESGSYLPGTSPRSEPKCESAPGPGLPSTPCSRAIARKRSPCGWRSVVSKMPGR